jgi:hypothetical protein
MVFIIYHSLRNIFRSWNPSWVYTHISLGVITLDTFNMATIKCPYIMKEGYGVQNTIACIYFSMHEAATELWKLQRHISLLYDFLVRKITTILTIIILFIFTDIYHAIKLKNVLKITQQHLVIVRYFLEIIIHFSIQRE